MEFIETEKAPKAVGPYSQGALAGTFIFTSGQLPINPDTGDLIRGDIRKATRQSLENVLAVVEAKGGKKQGIFKVTVFVADMALFPQINAVYAEFFGDHKPARSLVQVATLPLDGDIEIEAVCCI